MGRLLLISGLLLAGVGVFLLLGGRIGWLGRLPGDIRIEREGFSIFLPITTCLLLSAVLSVALYLLGRFLR